jgi:hypothetical protein
VNNSGQLRDRACMLRIPTGIRLTVLKMHVHNRKVCERNFNNGIWEIHQEKCLTYFFY